jgi:prolyl oligopeptidase
MKKHGLAFAILVVTFLALTSIGFLTSAQELQYPKTKKVDHVDTYHDVKVPDPYRWLEDENSAETARWVEEQNKVTFAYLENIPFRTKIRERLEKLYNYPKYSPPGRRGQYFFFTKNDGLQNQSVYYLQKGLDGTPEVLIDPNKFSEDGTSRMGTFSLAKDGKYVVYGISKGGSDWQDYHVMEVASKKTLADKLKWIKGGGVAWRGDGFFYSRYDAPEKGKELSFKNENQRVYFHKVGTQQSEDELVYEDKANPQRFHNVRTTEDERFAILSISERGKGKKGNAIFYRDLSQGEKSFTPIIGEIGNDSFRVIDNIGDKFLIETDKNAPNSKVILYDPKDPEEKNGKTVLPEKPEPLQSVTISGGKLFATYLKDVATRAYVYSLDGKLENEVKLPGLGSAGGFGGRSDDKVVFYTFNSFNYPQTIFRYDIATRKSTIFRSPEIPDFKPADYETKQVFYNSKDGTRVPMFLVYRKGLKLDGKNPTLLYGYGGFNITTSPAFNSMRLALLEQGFVYASANLRGGGEYGEKWHEAGTKLRKQNVFDDFIAAAEWLIAQKYTSPQRLAINGGSNGGLLVGAVMNQRPELFRAAIPQVGVMDMLRFHKFTIGWNWIADYGSSDNPEEFKALRAYSPLHNMREGVKYPATLITTADHDDRVVPAHSFKYAATLQEKAGRENLVLIRIDTKSGHGASSTTKAIEQVADIYSFLMSNLGVTPKYDGIASSVTQTSDNLSPAVIANIETLITKEMERVKAPALSLAIATGNKLRYAKGYGKADLENQVPAQETTLYRTASIAKALTATAVMQLAEKGKIDLDTPIQKYCPAFPQKQWPVTARQLLGHLGGIRHYKSAEEATGTTAYFKLSDTLILFKEDSLLHEPGTKFNYTTFGYSVLGCAIEGASGMSYEGYMRQHVFQPAGMNHTGLDHSWLVIPNRARGYMTFDERSYNRLPQAAKQYTKIGEVYNAPLHDTSMKVPGGGLISTSVDLVKLAIAVNTGALINEKSRDQMWRKQKIKNGDETTYGLGWVVGQVSGIKTVSHSGGQAGTSTYLLLVPEKGLAIGLMSNLQGFAMDRLAQGIEAILLSSSQQSGN